MSRRVSIGLIAILMMVVAGWTSGARSHIALEVTPAFAMAPATMVARITVEADAENRALEFSADSGDFYRSSEIMLDGDHAPHITTIRFPDMPAGAYDVQVTLLGSGGEVRAVARQAVNIVGLD